MKTIDVVAAVIIDGNKVFATQRGYGDYKDKWEFPGGKVESGELPEVALVREIKEELNTEVSVEQYIDTIDYDYPDFHLRMMCFRCGIVKGDLKLLEHKSSTWIDADSINDLDWLPADRILLPRIKRILKARRN